nr:MAG TPA: hypothetical protein [Caudoviricetes sp.]
MRAQLCEHARSTTRALVFWVHVFWVGVCCIHHTLSSTPQHCSLLTVTVLNIEHCAPLITL